jgi:hypothetical protein
MASDVKLILDERLIKTGTIILDTDLYAETPCEDFERYEREQDDSDLWISVHRGTGEVLGISLEDFKHETDYAIKMLRDYPLPWTFSLAQLSIREKPLEDVFLAIYKKYKNVKTDWE